MDYNVKPKKLTRQEKAIPLTIPQLIRKYKLDSLWDNIEKIVKEVIEQNSGYVVKKDGVMYIADNNDLEKAKVVLRIGKNFLDISNNGIDGDYQTIISLDGTINADFIKTGSIDAEKVEVKNLNASNITSGTMKADNIKGGTLTLGGENNQSGELEVVDEKGGTIFEASKDGLILPNGTKLIGNEGILSNLQFGQYEWSKIGYSTDYAPTGIGEWLYIDIPLFVPENFIITHAYITIEHSPVVYSYFSNYPEEISRSIWGYSRNIRAYKQDEGQDFFEEVELRSELLPKNNLATTEIVNAFGQDGFNPTVANNDNHITEKVTSIDIKDYLTSGKAETIQIRSGNEMPEFSPDLDMYQTNYLEQTGNVKAVINVFGYMK